MDKIHPRGFELKITVIVGTRVRYMLMVGSHGTNKGVGRKIFRGRGAPKKQDLKIAPLSLSLLYQCHVSKSREGHGPL